jgi:hypothetical protein
MCSSGQPAAAPGTVVAAASAAEGGLEFLARAEAVSVPPAALADCLRSLERAEARLVAARSVVLAGFTTQDGHLDDGQQSPRSWLRWQARVTTGAAAAATGWMRRLAAHPAVGAAMASGVITVSWARKVCDWTDRLPAEHRAGADQVLLDAAAGGADLPDLSALAEEIYRRTAPPDTGDDGGFKDRSARLDRTFGGGGSLTGDLTPACAAAVGAWLESMSKWLGPGDTRTLAQRTHDALEEGARRLISTGTLPDRAGQPAQVQLMIPFGRLRTLPGADDAMAEWAAAAAADGRPGWLRTGGRGGCWTARRRRGTRVTPPPGHRLPTHDQPGPGHRRRHRHGPALHAPGPGATGQALRRPRLPPQAHRLPRAPHHPEVSGRRHRPA